MISLTWYEMLVLYCIIVPFISMFTGEFLRFGIDPRHGKRRGVKYRRNTC